MERISEEIIDMLGEWKIVKFLGAGQYGKVYEIQRTDFGNTYRAALKIITIPQSAEEVTEMKAAGMNDAETSNYFKTVAEDFVREFTLMEKLKGYTNIVCYEDHQIIPDDDGIGWTILIRMELLTSLTRYISEKQMTKRDVIKMGIDLCKALELCQRVNIIHRDIKPANIFVSEMGEYKLGDFGVARIVENTMSGRTGTDTYMAPEVYYEEKYGPSADIYSLGIVMYRLLNSNRAPFLPLPPKPVTYRDNAEAFRRRINGEKLETPVQADGRLAEIVLKACAYRREDRYSSPETMRKELEKILHEIYSCSDQILLSEKPEIKGESGNYGDGRQDYREDETIMLRRKDIEVSEKKERPKLNISEPGKEQTEETKKQTERFIGENESLDSQVGDDKQRVVEQNPFEEKMGEKESHKKKESSNSRKQKWMIPAGIAAVLILCISVVFLTRNPKEGRFLGEILEEAGVTEGQEITLEEAGITENMEASYKESTEQAIDTVSEFTDDDIEKFMEEVSDSFSLQAVDNWRKVKERLGKYVEMGSQEVKAYSNNIIIIISYAKYEKKNVAVALILKKEKNEETPLNLIWE